MREKVRDDILMGSCMQQRLLFLEIGYDEEGEIQRFDCTDSECDRFVCKHSEGDARKQFLSLVSFADPRSGIGEGDITRSTCPNCNHDSVVQMEMVSFCQLCPYASYEKISSQCPECKKMSVDWNYEYYECSSCGYVRTHRFKQSLEGDIRRYEKLMEKEIEKEVMEGDE